MSASEPARPPVPAPVPLAPADLVLAWLTAAAPEGAKSSDLSKALKSVFSHRYSAGQTAALLTDAVAALETGGLITRPGRGRLALTEAGRARVRRDLSLSDAPPAGGWSGLRNGPLTARLLGLAPGDAGAVAFLRSADGLRAAILRAAFGLTLDTPMPSLAQLRDALVWHRFEQLTGKPAGTLRKTSPGTGPLALLLLADLAGGSAQGKWTDLVGRIATLAAGAKRNTADDLRTALIRRALETAGRAVAPVVAEPAPALDLPGFARTVKQAAAATDTGRFGDDKVLICHVWRTLQQKGGLPGLDLAGFKERLLSAHQDDLIGLARADLPATLPPREIEESVVRHHNAEWHFLRLDR